MVFLGRTQALSKNGEYIGERYVRLLHVPRSEMEEQVRKLRARCCLHVTCDGVQLALARCSGGAGMDITHARQQQLLQPGLA